MSDSPHKLPAIPLSGLRPDSLGNYLASLGLLRVLAKKWPAVRISWREDVLQVVAGPDSLDSLLDQVMELATNKEWTPYGRGWVEKQKESTKYKSGAPLAEWQANAPEEHLELFAAHVVPRDRVYFNPLLGSGGNAGKRAFSDGWKKAIDELQREEDKLVRDELTSQLIGRPVSWLLEKMNAASWFSDANKLYNSGQNPYREGLISPWGMVLACEGLPFFAGAASRRLGSRARAAGAFPFVTQAASSGCSGEAGRNSAEVWAPLWDRPMALPEVRTLFARARAEVRGRGVTTPAAFATAIVKRGVDAGITSFQRFSLGRTTSSNTFESRFEGRMVLPSSELPNCAAEAVTPLASFLERILSLVDRLPRDEKKGNRWRFVGLRGPIERAMIQVAASPADPARACDLLDAVVAALDRVDRNQNHRARQISWVPFPVALLPAIFGHSIPPIEARLALSVVSGFPASRPFALYRLGVDWQNGQYVHPKQAPFRWVWGTGKLSRVLANVLARRVLDWEKATKHGCREEPPARILFPASLRDVSAWLDGQVDERLVERWLSRLALFDWRAEPAHLIAGAFGLENERAPVSGGLALFGLLRPLFDLQPVYRQGSNEDLLDDMSGARSPTVARMSMALIRTGQVDTAVAIATSRYAISKTLLVKTDTPWTIEDPERLLASFLFTTTLPDREFLVQRWIRPQRERKGERAHA